MNRLPLFPLLLGVMALVLMGCTANVNLTVYEEEQYGAVMKVELPNMGSQMDGIATQLDDYVTPIREQDGISRAEWQEARAENVANVAYEVIVEGENRTLDAVLEGAQLTPTTFDGREALQFSYMSVPMIPYTLTLTAGEILQSNGDDLGGGQVRWVNGGNMQATVTPRSRSPFNLGLGWIVGGGLVLAIAAVGVYGYRQGYFSGRQVAAFSAVPLNCRYCGELFTDKNEKFCPECGNPRT